MVVTKIEGYNYYEYDRARLIEAFCKKPVQR